MVTAVCNHCFEDIPAELEVDDTGVWLVKECRTHGVQRAQMEVAAPSFFGALEKGPDAQRWYDYISITGLDVTDKCNVKCPHCYALPDNRIANKSIASIVETAHLAVKGKGLTLMGAEPTMRNDLHELVTALRAGTGKPVSVYTNAVRLSDARYFDTQCKDVSQFCVSLHTTKYLNDPEAYARKLEGLEAIRRSGKPLAQLSFSLLNLDDIEEAIDTARQYAGLAEHIRIRSPGATGTCTTEPFFLSSLIARFDAAMQARGLTVVLYPSDNNPYHVNAFAGGQLWRLICAPSVETMVLEYMQTPPYALFVPEIGETNLVHQGIMQVGIKTGKYKWKS
jgi:hypothetical protein